MKLLVLDTALNACSVCVCDGAAVLAGMSEPMSRGHQERLAPMAAEVMAQAGLAFAALDRVGVVVGPGSFTGLRVGLAFAKGLSLALDIACVGVGTLEALAAGERGLVTAVIAGKPGQVFVQAFDGGSPLSPPHSGAIEAAAEQLTATAAGRPIRLMGPGASLLAPFVTRAELVDRDHVAVERLAALVAAAPAPSAAPSPIYLRRPDARTLAERAATL